MAATKTPKKRERGPRISAEERRELVVDVAVAEFAGRGLHGTPTQEIAEQAGISHAYLFRLFPTKTDLFIAVTERCFQQVQGAFAAAAAGAEPGEERLHAMGEAYVGLLADRNRLLVQLQSYAACDDPKVRKAVQRGWEDLWGFVERESGADAEQVREFFAMGMLLTVAAAVDLFSAGEKWTQRIMPADKT
ncbi:MAG TPA: helix-turn-helix domain-containing protein [Thermoleophilaceae bacterium]|nr:helix-turn-helix domain-containing protein [Thermoleophilaceae bacterium]